MLRFQETIRAIRWVDEQNTETLPSAGLLLRVPDPGRWLLASGSPRSNVARSRTNQARRS